MKGSVLASYEIPLQDCGVAPAKGHVLNGGVYSTLKRSSITSALAPSFSSFPLLRDAAVVGLSLGL